MAKHTQNLTLLLITLKDFVNILNQLQTYDEFFLNYWQVSLTMYIRGWGLVLQKAVIAWYR